MIKVLHCITDLSPDGAQRTLLRLLTGLRKTEFQNVVVTLAPGGHLVEQFAAAGIRVESLGMRRGIPSVRAILRLRSLVREVQPELIQGWMYHGNLAALTAAALSEKKVPVLWNIRRCLYDIREDKRLTRAVISLGARMSSRAEKIIYCVRVAGDQHEAIGFDPEKRIVIPNGFDISRFNPSKAGRASLRSELGLGPDTLLVGIAGRYHPQKDYPTFFRSAAKVLERRPDVHFVMIGRGVTVDCEEAFQHLSALGLERNVHLLGERNDLPALMPALDVFCSSSANEGFSNVVSEAMACGIPCAVTDAGASRELVEGLGPVVNRGDHTALAQGILELLSVSAEERERIGLEGRSRIIEAYTLDAMVTRYRDLYRGMCELTLDRVVDRQAA